MATTAQEEIYDLALGELGDTEITSGLSSTKQYIICDRFYNLSKKEVLVSHPWNCATRSAQIIQSGVPDFGYNRQYTKPSDCLRVWDIEYETKWRRAGNYILTDSGTSPDNWVTATDYVVGDYVTSSCNTYICATAHTSGTFATDLASGYWTLIGEDYTLLNAWCIYDIDEDDFDPNVQGLVALRLATHICYPLMQDGKLKATLMEIYNRIALPQARTIDGQEGSINNFYHSTWLEARK